MFKKITVWTFVILLLAVLSYTTYWQAERYFQTEEKPQVAGINEIPKLPEKPAPQEIYPTQLNSKLMFFGDVFWGRYVQDWSEKSELKTAYPFSGLKDFKRENYDAWIGSLNCPITTNVISSREQDRLLKFNCRPEYLPEASKWFNVFSLANSHTDNMDGLEGLNSTKKYLKDYNIQYFGHYDKDVLDEICNLVFIDSKPAFDKSDLQKDNTIRQEKYQIPIAFCGYHNTFSVPTEVQLAQITKYSKYFPTVVYAIQGAEYPIKADGLQEKYFRAMIDAGGDAVIGKSAHVVQNTEAYKGKLIYYSLGNFIYDQQFNADVTQATAVGMNIEFAKQDNLDNWLKLGIECQLEIANCFEIAESKKVQKPVFKLSYELTATDNMGKLAKIGSPVVLEKMLKRTNWQETMQKLK